MTSRRKEQWVTYVKGWTSLLRGTRDVDSQRYFKLRGRLDRDYARVIEMRVPEGQVRSIATCMLDWLKATPFDDSAPVTNAQPVNLAGCVITDATGAVLLLHRNTERRTHWEIPGGKVNPGEIARDAAVREVREELGIDVEVAYHIGTCRFVEDGTQFAYHWYRARVITGTLSLVEPHTFDGYGHFRLDVPGTLQGHLSQSANQLVDRIVDGTSGIRM